MSLSQARARARRRAPSQSVAAAAEDWLKRRVLAGGFRTLRERERVVEGYILPALGSRAMADVRRDDLTELLDRIASHERSLRMHSREPQLPRLRL